jgi:signal transduction histidine kinase
VTGTIGVRLALWYAGVFVASVAVVVVLTYALLAASLRQRDQEMVVSTLRDYASRYEAGGLAAVVDAVELEQRAGTRERLFVRLLGRGQDLLFATMPPEWGSFDVDRLRGADRDALQEAPARNRDAVLEVASTRLWDGTLLQVGKSSESRELLLQRFRAVAFGVSIAILLVGGTGGYLLTRSTLAPVRELAAVTKDIVATGRTDARVPAGTSGDALDELSTSFNAMLDRIGALIGGMREALDNVAHDLRTPLARLRAGAERALASGSPETQREALADCLEESDRILAILNTLMDISEAETGTIRLALEPVALGPLAAEVAELYEDVAADKQVTLLVDASPDVTITGDRERLRQALANLVDNAIKYGPPAATVTITVRGDSQGACVDVQDEGPGIPADELPRVWERLFRGDRSRSERGLGLGLSLVRAFVSAHGGRASVESGPGRGSTFSLHIPAVPPLRSPDITRL